MVRLYITMHRAPRRPHICGARELDLNVGCCSGTLLIVNNKRMEATPWNLNHKRNLLFLLNGYKYKVL